MATPLAPTGGNYSGYEQTKAPSYDPELAETDAHIDRFYHCPFHEEGEIARYRKDSFDRKPKPGMLMSAMADFPVAREKSFLIGDKQTDIEAAHAAGVGGFFFTGGNVHQFAEWALADFEDGAR